MAEFLTADQEREKNEGGYALVKGDTGLETYAGITRKNFPNWSGWKIVDARKPLKNGAIIKSDALQALIRKFYKETFWDAIGGDDIDNQAIANRLYDFGVNAGQKTSIKQIQAALNLPESGRIDDALIEAINNPTNYLLK